MTPLIRPLASSDGTCELGQCLKFQAVGPGALDENLKEIS
jgi:hypothetical protein